MIKAIIFDWGGVLIDNPADALMSHCANHLGTTKEILKKTIDKYIFDFQKGTLLEEDLWNQVCDELNINKPTTNSLWQEAVKNVFVDKKETHELIGKLKENGYKIGFLSNTEIPTMTYFHDNNYGRHFDEAVFSCLENTAKPEKEIYHVILKKLQLEPHETIFIDDKPEYIDGATKVGINGIIFQDIEQVKKELNDLGIDTN